MLLFEFAQPCIRLSCSPAKDARDDTVPGFVFRFTRRAWGFELFEERKGKSYSVCWQPAWTAPSLPQHQADFELTKLEGLDEAEDADLAEDEPVEDCEEDEDSFEIPGKLPAKNEGTDTVRRALKSKQEEQQEELEDQIRDLKAIIRKMAIDKGFESQERSTELEQLRGTLQRMQQDHAKLQKKNIELARQALALQEKEQKTDELKKEEMKKMEEEHEELVRSMEAQKKLLHERQRQDQRMQEELLDLQSELDRTKSAEGSAKQLVEKLQQLLSEQTSKQAAVEKLNAELVEKEEERRGKLSECQVEVFELPPQADSLGLMALIVSNQLLERLGREAEELSQMGMC